MIFVTVGTHEQPFDRLVREMDALVENGTIQEEVVIQTGFSTYEPKHCTWSKLIPYQQMEENVRKARIVITHGGPASFIMPLQVGKIPVVVPRQKKYDEHVNDHQLEFSLAVAQRQNNIIVIENIEDLAPTIAGYQQKVEAMSAAAQNHNEKFMEGFREIVAQLLPDKR